MALDPVFDELLKALDPADAEKQRALFEKYEPLRGGYLRQADYSRKVSEAETQRKEAEEAAKKNHDWYERNTARHKSVMDDNDRLQKEVARITGELSKATSGEVGVDEATLNARVEARVKELGYVTKSDMTKIVEEEGKKLAGEAAKAALTEQTTKFLTETWPAAQAINQAMITIQFGHMQEFGKPLSKDDQEAIAKQMKESNTFDPYKAYDQWIAPKRDEKRIEAEVEKRVTAKLSQTFMPGVSNLPAPADVGHMQLKSVGDKALATLPEGSKIGDMSAAAAAAAELVAEGKY